MVFIISLRVSPSAPLASMPIRYVTLMGDTTVDDSCDTPLNSFSANALFLSISCCCASDRTRYCSSMLWPGAGLDATALSPNAAASLCAFFCVLHDAVSIDTATVAMSVDFAIVLFMSLFVFRRFYWPRVSVTSAALTLLVGRLFCKENGMYAVFLACEKDALTVFI